MPASQDFVYPQPADHDDDDVVWALQTGNVEWQRGATADALVWLRRAIESANAAGNAFRASEIQAAVDELAEIVWSGGEQASVAAAARPASLPPDFLDSELDDTDFEEVEEAGAEELSDDDLVAEEAWLAEDTSETAVDPPESLDPETLAASALLSESDESEATVVGSIDGLSAYDSEPGDAADGSALDDDPMERTVLDALPPEGLDDESLPSYALDEPPAAGDALPSYALDEPEADEYPPDPAPAAGRASPRSLPPIPQLRRSAEPGLDAIVSSVPSVPLDLGVDPVDLAIATSLEESPRSNLAVVEVAARPSSQVIVKPVVDGVPLNDCLGFEDLPEEIQIKLAMTARLERLNVDEELSAFGAALVTHGAAAVVTDISDEPALLATKGDVVFTEGSLVDGTKLRVVSTLESTVIAVWSRADLEEVLQDCPWVEETLRAIADRFQALAGVTLGTLGERLDASLRRGVVDRMDVRAYAPGEQVIGKGVPMPGLYIVAAGRVELLNDDNSQVVSDLLPGDFLFPQGVLSAGAAPSTARAGAKGALLLAANRSVAHELVTSVPPLLEALVS